MRAPLARHQANDDVDYAIGTATRDPATLTFSYDDPMHGAGKRPMAVANAESDTARARIHRGAAKDAINLRADREDWDEGRRIEALREVDRRVRREERAVADAQAAARGAALTIAERLGRGFVDVQQIPSKIVSGLAPDDLRRITAQAAANENPVPVAEAGDAAARLNILATQDRAAFAKTDLRLFRHEMTDAEYRGLSELQGDIRANPNSPAAATNDAIWRKVVDTVPGLLQHANTSAHRNGLALRTAIKGELDRVTAGKRQPTMAELLEARDQVMMQSRRQMIPGALSTVNPNDIMRSAIDDAEWVNAVYRPKDDVAVVIQAGSPFQRRDTPVTPNGRSVGETIFHTLTAPFRPRHAGLSSTVMVPGMTRPLSEAEISRLLGINADGRKIGERYTFLTRDELQLIRIRSARRGLRNPLDTVSNNTDNAITPGKRTIIFPAKSAERDFSEGENFDWLIHEINHSHQYYIMNRAAVWVAGPLSYSYDYEVIPGRSYRQYNVEQQSSMMADLYRREHYQPARHSADQHISPIVLRRFIFGSQGRGR